MNVQQGKWRMFVTYSLYLLLLYLFPCRLSASCVYVSALLHVLVALTPNVDVCDNSDDNVPVIFLSCQWKPPQKCKHYQYLRLTLISLNMAKPVNIVCSCWKTMILDLRNLESQV